MMGFRTSKERIFKENAADIAGLASYFAYKKLDGGVLLENDKFRISHDISNMLGGINALSTIWIISASGDLRQEYKKIVSDLEKSLEINKESGLVGIAAPQSTALRTYGVWQMSPEKLKQMYLVATKSHSHQVAAISFLQGDWLAYLRAFGKTHPTQRDVSLHDFGSVSRVLENTWRG